MLNLTPLTRQGLDLSHPVMGYTRYRERSFFHSMHLARAPSQTFFDTLAPMFSAVINRRRGRESVYIKDLKDRPNGNKIRRQHFLPTSEDQEIFPLARKVFLRQIFLTRPFRATLEIYGQESRAGG